MKHTTSLIKHVTMSMVLLVGSPVGFAATVIENPFAWSCLHDDDISGRFSIEWYSVDFGIGSSVWIDVMGNFVSDGNRATMTADGGVLESIGNWVKAEYGTCVDASTVRNQKEYFQRGPFDDGGTSTYDVTIEQDHITYLAFCGEILSGDMSSLARTGVYLYGWVSLGVDENGIPVLTGSAIDLDGGPMIVGGGAWTGGIPEPSGGMLFLLGMAMLGLRRRGQMPDTKTR